MRRSSPRHLREPERTPAPPRHLGPSTGPTRAPTPTRARSPRLLLGGTAVIGLVVALAVAGLPLPRADALRLSQAVWQAKCNIARTAADDPILLPGQPGRATLNDFFGNTSVNASSSASTLARGGSTCLRGLDQVDKAAYWAPVLLRNGTPVTGSPDEHRIDAYYAVLDKPVPVQPIPFGLRMLAGDANARSPQPNKVVHFNCLDSPNGGHVTGDSATIPTCPQGTYLSAMVEFPGCWDGRNLDSADHRSHMAYAANGACPASHPVRLPSLRLRIRWKTAVAVPSSQLSFSSGGQLSLHASFWNAWSPAAMQWLVDNCLNKVRNCVDITRSQIAAPATFPSGP